VDERLIKARAKVLVAAPGLIERPYVFAGNDKPGVMLSSAVQRLVNLYAVRPGRRAVVLSANADGDEVVNVLERAGVTIAGVVDARSGGDVVRAVGRGGVRAVDLPNGTRLDADLLVTATGWTAPTALLNMAGTTVHYEPRAARFFPSQLPGSVLATGGIVGDGSIDELLAHGQAVGSAAAQRSARLARQWRSVTPTAAVVDKAEVDAAPVEVPALPIDDHPALFRSTTHGIVDFSEDVSSNDIMAAAREGYDSIELAKRYTTATMGLTQGKLELMNAIAVHAEATGRTIEETGTTTWRPPYAPVSLGALAGRAVDPVAVSPMHSWHIAHGASPLIAGQWIRPDHYGDAEGEVRNVRENVGIIDVTPLGKFDLRGPDVSNLLNLLYVNRWSKLAVGSVRYGVMCGHDGVVLDDGVTGRLAEDRYMLTTTSSGPEVVWRWMEEWLQTEHPQWRIHITPATNTYASINVAGPKAREVMQRLVEGVDLEPSAFPYMRVRMGRIAGVDECFMWRIGFTGELSYELHVPAAYGLYVWETLLEVGDDLGIRPFGIEAQRIMRLEKGHLLVAQDTDGLTQGFGASLGGLIKLEKSTFVGKPELVWQQAHNDYLRLVGLQPDDGTIVPDEGSQLVEDVNTIVGRVTSSRMSPTLGRSICLGFVTPALTEPGSKVTIQLPDGRRVPATVTENLAHFDPEGARLRG
jgi:sarcosine oxidase subunit alpha